MGTKTVCLNTGELNEETGIPEVEGLELLAAGPDADLPENRVPLGKIPMFQALGISSMPFPPDSDGTQWAEGVCIENVGGWNMVCVGARDHRSARIYGNLGPGDTAIHCTGPEPKPMILLKREKRQVALVTKDESDVMLLSVLDGKNRRYQLNVDGHMVEVSRASGITFTDKTGKAGIQIKDGTVSIFGTVVLGGRIPTLPVLAGLSGPAGAATPGVFVGA